MSSLSPLEITQMPVAPVPGKWEHEDQGHPLLYIRFKISLNYMRLSQKTKLGLFTLPKWGHRTETYCRFPTTPNSWAQKTAKCLSYKCTALYLAQNILQTKWNHRKQLYRLMEAFIFLVLFYQRRLVLNCLPLPPEWKLQSWTDYNNIFKARRITCEDCELMYLFQLW